MKFIFALCIFCTTTLLNADSTFSSDRLTEFYDEYFCDEKNDLSSAGISSPCSFTPTPPPPPPPPAGSIPPAPVDGYFAVVISNGTGQLDEDVYFLGLPNSNTEFFTLSGAFPGALSTVAVTDTTFSASPLYSYPLSSLPKSTTGDHDYLVYVPYSSSDRLYFSIGNPLYFESDSGTSNPSIGNNFYDPNYNVLYDFAEITFATAVPPMMGQIPWTATVDTTQVDGLALPIKLGFYSYNAADPTAVTAFIGTVGQPATNPAGFEIARDTLVSDIVTGLGASSASGTWENLALPFHTTPYNPTTPTTYLRVMAPKHGGTLSQPQGGNYTIPEFPASTYLANNGNGYDYLSTLFAFYTGGTELYMQTPAMTGPVVGDTYHGSVTGSTFLFTGTTDSSRTMTLDLMAITVENLFSGNVPITNTGSTPATEVSLLQNYFSSAFVVGLLGISGTFDTSGAPLSEPNLQGHLQNSGVSSTPNYYTNNFSMPGTSDPGYDLYAQLLHQKAILPASPPFNTPYPTLGLCYAYDFDDTLGFSSAITPPATTPTSDNVYTIITLGAVDTVPTGVFDDATSYALTFSFTGTLGYRQGTSGSFISVMTSPTMVGMFSSTSSDPFQIQYNTKIYNVFPKYQFLQPVGEYNSVQQSVIQGVTFTPSGPATAPTGFTIALP